MSTFPTNTALEAAIVAHAGEDTPRLAYADWLDEHGDPDRAEFIRVQCRLAEMSPAEPDWIDLRERQWELVARLRTRLEAGIGETADRFYFEPLMVDGLDEPFRRGFPYRIDIQHEGEEWIPAAVRAGTAEVDRLLRTTTVRAFIFYTIPPAALATVLAAPAAPLAGLEVCADWPDGPLNDDVRAFYEFIATNPALRSVRELGIYGETPTVGVAELAKATALDSVRWLTLQNLRASKSILYYLTKVEWFRRLHFFRTELEDAAVAVPVLTDLGKLRDLHTLELPHLVADGVAPLVAGKFPALAALAYGGPITAPYLKRLAKAKFPALTTFKVSQSNGLLKNDGLAELLQADWFGRLRVLDLWNSGVGDRGVKALAAHPVAKTLRVLQLRNNPFGKGGLAAATRGTFPALTSLELGWHDKRKGAPDELAAVLAAVDMPRLRYLDLSGWPLGNAGAKALAANPTLAGVTRLDLSECGIGDPGAKALFASPHLRNLVELNLSHNAIKNGAASLADPDTLPRLGECSLSGNKIPKKAAATFARDGLHLNT